MQRRGSEHKPASSGSDGVLDGSTLYPRSPAVAAAVPVQAWRAWADCGDGGQVHLILDEPARQVWLLPVENIDPTARGQR